jgi:hypothetical protein
MLKDEIEKKSIKKTKKKQVKSTRVNLPNPQPGLCG